MNKIVKDVKNKLISLLKEFNHDILMGTIYDWKKYIVIIFIFIFLCLGFQRRVHLEISCGEIQSLPTFADYVIDIYKGMDIFEANNKMERFEIPSGWIVMNIYISFIVGYYPLNDLKTYSPHILLRSKSRSQWWFSKCMWITASVFIYYSIAYIIIGIFALFNGGISLVPTYDINILVSDIDTYNFTWQQVAFTAMVLPIITSGAFSLLQMFISLFSNSIVSNMVSITIIIVSAYYCNPFLIGNYLMIWRNSIVISSKGVTTNMGIGIGIFISIMSIWVGSIKFKKVDILSK